MHAVKKTKFIVALSLLLALASVIGYSYLQQGRAWVSEGRTPVTDHRELPVREAATTEIVSGLDAPWGFDWLPNGDVLITERYGALRIVRGGALEPESIPGLPAISVVGQGGLLDVSVHPDFENNRWVYLSYSAGSPEANRLQVVRAELNGGRLEQLKVIFKVVSAKSGGGHFGSRFAWLPDGTLLFSVGDGGNPPIEFEGALIRAQAQSLDEHFGKIVRIHDDGTIPMDNPFLNDPDAQSEIWSYGHRNVQGLTYDSVFGRLLASEHGSQGGDELNKIDSGANYGWPRTTYSREYDLTGSLITPHQVLPGIREPAAVWTPSIAPSGLLVYSGDRYDGARGDVFLSAMLLRDNTTILAYLSEPAGALLRLKAGPEGVFSAQEKIYLGAIRVRDVGQGPDGYLYVLTDTTEFPAEPGAKAGALRRIDRF